MGPFRVTYSQLGVKHSTVKGQHLAIRIATTPEVDAHIVSSFTLDNFGQKKEIRVSEIREHGPSDAFFNLLMLSSGHMKMKVKMMVLL